ncbi:equilibrative nucleobase transporter 1-like [Vanacampus margaritifer]
MSLCQKSCGVQRGLTLFTGGVECLGFAGIIFGWASLAFTLKQQGFFSSYCVNATGVDGLQVSDCSGQDEQFSLVFTIASLMNNFLTLLIGFIFDRFGTLILRLLAICLYTLGTLLLAFSTPALASLIFPGLALIALGGNMLLLTNIQVGNLFGTHRSTVITLLNGAFDSSAVVFLIIKLSPCGIVVAYQAGISLKASFLFVSACSIIHLLRTFFLLPRTIIPYPLPDHYTYGFSCGKLKKSDDSDNIDPQMSTNETQSAQQDCAKPEKTFRECVLSKLFFFCLIWFSVIQLRLVLFIGTLQPTLDLLTGGEPSLVGQYINAFAFTQLCGFLCAPWNGFIMDRLKRKYKVAGMSDCEAELNSSLISIFVTALMALVFSICSAIPVLPLQYFTFVMQVLCRAFLFGGNATFISVAFPPCHFGKVFGLMLTLGAAVTLLQFACFTVVEDVLDGDPLYVNIAMVLLMLFSFIHPLSLFLHCRRIAAQRTKYAM